MEKTGYEHESNINYLTIQANEDREKSFYQIKMLMHNEIQGLLDFSIRNVNNRTYYYYNITSGKPVSKLYDFGKITWDNVVMICKSLDILTKALDKYMLDINCVLIYPEYMYMNISEKEIKYVYCPDTEKEFQDMLKGLFEFILEHYEHGTDKKHQMQLYEIYQKVAEGNYKINCLSDLTKDRIDVNTDNNEKILNETIDFPQKQEKEVVIPEIIPENITTEEEIQPQEKIKSAEIGMCICAAAILYLTASLFVPEKVLFCVNAPLSMVLIIVFALICTFLHKLRKKWKETGEIKQITQEKEYSFTPNEEVVSDFKEEMKESNVQDEMSEGNTILLSEYLKKKNKNVIKLILQNQQEQDAYYEESIILDSFPCMIGNMAAYCSIVIHSELISRVHACVYKDEKNFYLEDMNSTNGTFLNGQRLTPKDKQVINDGDLVGFANLLYKVEKS